MSGSVALLKNKHLVNIEFERKREFERRKKLRLLQVRQQSKDFANELIERNKVETIRQRNKFFESKRKQIKERQLEELNRLKEIYGTCLKEVGESHRAAAKQPNFNLIKEAELARISAEAAVRGAKAKKQQFEQDMLQLQKLEAPIKQKNMTRNKENLRSFFISCLPQHKAGSADKSIHQPKSTNKISEPTRNRQVLQEVPSNLLVQESSAPELTVEKKTSKDIDSGRTLTSEFKKHNNKHLDKSCKYTAVNPREDNVSVTALPKECSCDYVVCCCHDSPRRLRRCYSDLRISSSDSISEIEVQTKRVKKRSRSCSPRSVRTLNYFDVGNLYESNQPNFTKVTHHPNPTSQDKNTIGNTVIEIPPVKEPDIKELKRKTEERGAKALYRQQLKRDFEKLLRDLRKLHSEKSLLKTKTKYKSEVYQRERDILEKNDAKQRKLTDAFEKLLHTVKPSLSQDKGPTAHQTVQSVIDESSPPRLNLATYHQINMSSRGNSPNQPSLIRRLISTEEITISQTSITEGAECPQSPPSRPKRTSPTRSLPSKSPPSSTQGPPSTSISSKPRSYSPSEPFQREQTRSKQSPEISVHTDPSGDLHVTVKVTEPVKHKKKCTRIRHSPDSSTSYFSPPENLSPSQKLLVDALLIQVNKEALNEDLKRYIKKLLSMSRESIDDLDSSLSSDYIDPTRSPPEKEIQEDIAKLSDLTELYADKVNTLVDMFEQLESPKDLFSPPQFLEPGPSTVEQRLPTVPLPSRIPIRQPQTSPIQTFGYATPGRTPQISPVHTPVSSRPRHVPQSGVRPTTQPLGSRRTPSPVQRIPRKPTTPPMQRRHKRSQSPRTPIVQVREVEPPKGSAESRIPIAQRYQSPQKPPAKSMPRQDVPGPSTIHTPFGLSANLLPHPRQVFGQLDAPLQPETVDTPQSQHPVSRLSPDSADDSTSWAFVGLPKAPPRDPRYDTEIKVDMSTFDPDKFDFEAELEKRGILHYFEHHRRKDSPQKKEKHESSFGGPLEGQDDWGDVQFGDEEFQDAADIILQTEAPEEGHVDYPEDFPPPTDVFGPGFDWTTANLSDPSWPESFPGDPLGGSSMEDKDQIAIDSSFDTGAVTYPLNVEKINEIRRKLSRICNDQYREVIEMLREEYATDDDKLGHILKRVGSDPFEDPDATLAPIAHEQTRPRSSARTPDRSPNLSFRSPKSEKAPSFLDERIDNLTSLSILVKSQEKYH